MVGKFNGNNKGTTVMKEGLRDRIYNLSKDDLQLLVLKISDSLESIREQNQNSGIKQLETYVIPNEHFSLDEFKLLLKENLPDYMLPNKINLVNGYPKLPNGKIDYSSLHLTTQIENSKSIEINEPINELEKELIKIWEEVLNFSPISINDNFFEIGGDSILSIQIIAKARKIGITLLPSQLFEHQTIAELALFSVKSQKEEVVKDKYGAIALTPIQNWFFDKHKIAPHYWNQIVEVKVEETISFDNLKLLVSKLIDHHDGLRQRFEMSNDKWISSLPETNTYKSSIYFDLGSFNDIQEQNKEIDRLLIENQKECNLSNQNLFRAIYFDCGKEQQNKVFLICHHLVIDMVSWGILKNDFISGIKELNDKKDLNFGQKSDSIKNWSSKIVKLANSESFLQELPFWTKHSKYQPILKDLIEGNVIWNMSNYHSIQFELSKEDSFRLLNETSKSFNTNIEDLMLVALTKMIAQWMNFDQVQIGLERHGRASDLVDLIDSDIVGWFTSYFPITIDIDSEAENEFLIKSIKEQLRQIPHQGIGYGILRYMTKEFNENKVNDNDPDILFNYLGKTDSNDTNYPIKFKEYNSVARHPKSEQSCLLEINAIIKNERLLLEWTYNKGCFTEKSMCKLIHSFEENLKEVILTCVVHDKVGYTPSDFPEAEINQEDLDNLLDLL